MPSALSMAQRASMCAAVTTIWVNYFKKRDQAQRQHPGQDPATKSQNNIGKR